MSPFLPPHPLERSESFALRADFCPRHRAALARSAIYNFSGLWVPDQRGLDTNTILIGSIGSGKTSVLKMFLRSVLGPLRMVSEKEWLLRHRLLLIDPKPELLGWIQSLCGPQHVAVLWPWTRGCTALDFKKTFRTATDTELFVDLFRSKDTRAKEHFFELAFRRCLRAVLKVFIQQATDFDGHDLVTAMSSDRYFFHVLSHHPEGADIKRTLFPANEAAGNIIQTLGTYFDEWRTLFDLFRLNAAHSVSIDAWAKGSGVLYLGGHPSGGSVAQRWNKFIVDVCLARVLGNLEENRLDETWIACDEYSTSELDLRASARLGRSRGCRHILACQSIDQLIDVSSGKKERAGELLSHFGNLWAGRNDNPETQAWLATLFGKYTVHYWEPSQGLSTSSGSNGGSSTSSINWAHRELERQNVYPYDIGNFRKGTYDTGFTYLARIPMGWPGWYGYLPGAHVKAHMFKGIPMHEAVVPPDTNDCPLAWNDADLDRLGLRSLEHVESVASEEPESDCADWLTF